MQRIICILQLKPEKSAAILLKTRYQSPTQPTPPNGGNTENQVKLQVRVQHCMGFGAGAWCYAGEVLFDSGVRAKASKVQIFPKAFVKRCKIAEIDVLANQKPC